MTLNQHKPPQTTMNHHEPPQTTMNHDIKPPQTLRYPKRALHKAIWLPCSLFFLSCPMCVLGSIPILSHNTFSFILCLPCPNSLGKIFSTIYFIPHLPSLFLTVLGLVDDIFPTLFGGSEWQDISWVSSPVTFEAFPSVMKIFQPWDYLPHRHCEQGSHFSRLTKFPDFSSIFFSIFQYFLNVLFF